MVIAPAHAEAGYQIRTHMRSTSGEQVGGTGSEHLAGIGSQSTTASSYCKVVFTGSPGQVPFGGSNKKHCCIMDRR